MSTDMKDVEYYENTDNQKIFSFGNIDSGKNVLVVIGSDIYKERIESVGSDSIENKILSYMVNPSLYYYYPTDPKSENFESKYKGEEYKNWKNEYLDLQNAYYYVIVTNKEENILSLIKSSGLVFNYFMLYFHGNRNYIEARFISRGDLVMNLNDSEIKSHFDKNCLGLMLACSVNGFDITNYSFAVLFSYALGIKNMIVSSSNIFDNLSSSYRKYYGNFKKVFYGDYDLESAYDKYINLSHIQSFNSSAQEHLIINLPNSVIIDNSAFGYLAPPFYLVYSSCDDYFDNLNITNSYCEVYLNYETEEVIWKYYTKFEDTVISSICYKLSSEYFDLLSFVCDVYNSSSVDYKYLDLAFH